MIHLLRENAAKGHTLINIVPDQVTFVPELAKRHPVEMIRSNAVVILGLFAQHPQLAQFVEVYMMITNKRLLADG